MPACHEVDGKPYLDKSLTGWSGKCPSTHECLEKTSDGEVLLHGYAVKCHVASSKKVRNSMVLFQIFVEPWSTKMRSSNSSARGPLTPSDAQIAFGFIWKVSIHQRNLEMTSDGEVLLHGYAANVAPSNIRIRNPEVLFLIFVEP